MPQMRSPEQVIPPIASLRYNVCFCLDEARFGCVPVNLPPKTLLVYAVVILCPLLTEHCLFALWFQSRTLPKHWCIRISHGRGLGMPACCKLSCIYISTASWSLFQDIFRKDIFFKALFSSWGSVYMPFRGRRWGVVLFCGSLGCNHSFVQNNGWNDVAQRHLISYTSSRSLPHFLDLRNTHCCLWCAHAISLFYVEWASLDEKSKLCLLQMEKNSRCCSNSSSVLICIVKLPIQSFQNASQLVKKQKDFGLEVSRCIFQTVQNTKHEWTQSFLVEPWFHTHHNNLGAMDIVNMLCESPWMRSVFCL